MDTNQDGMLQYDELCKGLTDLYGESYAVEECDRIFKLVDVDQSGEIDFSEFVTASVNKNELLKDEKLRAAFNVYDKDNSGSIQTDEIRDVLGVGKNITEEVWQQVVREVDENGDGEVSYEEFKMMMESLLSK